MNLIALPSEIVIKIFNFLDPYDVYSYKLAYPAWNLEATRWLSRCQAIETFSFSKIKAIIPSKLIDGKVVVVEKDKYPEQYKIMQQSVISNQLMNKDTTHESIVVQGDRGPSVHRHYLYWWYYKAKNEYHQIMRSDLGGCIETSLANSQRDHLFSFVTFPNNFYRNLNLKSLVKPTYESIPVVGLMIKQTSNTFDLGDEILDFDRKSFEKISKAPDPFKYKISIVKELNAFNINQWTTQTKIILTNWKSEHSLSCKYLYDTDYPIKSLVCFKTICRSYEPLELLVKNKDIIASNVVLDCFSKLYIKPRKWHEKNNTKLVSIAFAGRNVKAATSSIESLDSTTRADQLMAFRQSLDFPLNDGRIVGFIFIGDLFKGNVRSEILISIHKTFPHVNFMDISCREPENSPTAEQGLVEGIRIHLIHL